ncbi:MAG: carbohydrate kinase family protein [Caldilineaceae bacterium]
MFVVIGTVTADLMVCSEVALANLGGDGFRSSNLVFTDAPINISMGGNGGNSAYALAALGVPTALCGAVGQDLLGNALVDWLKERGVDLRGLLRSANEATSSSTIIMTDSANQVVFHHLGATRAAAFEDFPDALFAEASVLLVSSFSLMPKLRTGGFAHALRHVKQAGGITALDVGPAIGEPVTLQELLPLISDVDYLLANTHELVVLTNATSWQNGAKQALAAGIRQLVIKQGAAGSALWTESQQIHVPAFKVASNISVGAGDSFNAGFLYGVQQGWSWEQALRFGNATAALVVSGSRGILDSPTLQQVESFLHAQP